MFTGYEISKSSRDKILEQFPPTYKDVICHHITEKYGVTKDEAAPKNPDKVVVYAYINVDGVEGLLVSIDGVKMRPFDKSKYHITLSIDKASGKKPVDTNKHVNDAVENFTPFEITVKARNFYGL